jgi:hypothetical protein
MLVNNAIGQEIYISMTSGVTEDAQNKLECFLKRAAHTLYTNM